MTLNEISVRMKVLADECGGNHHTGKEAEEILNSLARELDDVALAITVATDAHYAKVRECTGRTEWSVREFLRQENIRQNAERFKESTDESKDVF